MSSAVELESLDVLVNALEEARVDCSAQQLVTVLNYFAKYGHHIVPVGRSANHDDGPKSIEPAPLSWPPLGLTTKLWATDFEPDHDKWAEITSYGVLHHYAQRGASFIAAANSTDARIYWNNQRREADQEFTINGMTFKYHSDMTPF